jgi:hypothetical protein
MAPFAEDFSVKLISAVISSDPRLFLAFVRNEESVRSGLAPAIDTARTNIDKEPGCAIVVPAFELAQSAFICEDELLERHEWLTDDLGACVIGSS